MADFGSTFERLELKYLITEDLAERIRAAIQPWCSPDPHNGDVASGGYLIENLYLDTHSREFYRAWKRADNDRIKLRIRTYGPDSGPAFLEVKRKVSSVISKIRVGVDRHRVEDAALGYVGPLVQTDEARRIQQQFAHFTARTGARPALSVTYEREAWASSLDRYARVTFDRRMRVQACDDWRLGGDPHGTWLPLDESWLLDGLRSPLVLELKCETSVPLWMSRLITEFQLDLKGFSKYGYGVDALLRANGGADARALSGAHYV